MEKFDFNDFMVIVSSSLSEMHWIDKPAIVIDLNECDGPDYKIMAHIMERAMHSAGFLFEDIFAQTEWSKRCSIEIFEQMFL